jgi:hypothetical protein
MISICRFFVTQKLFNSMNYVYSTIKLFFEQFKLLFKRRRRIQWWQLFFEQFKLLFERRWRVQWWQLSFEQFKLLFERRWWV